MTNSDLETRLREAVGALPHGLRDHVLRVEAEAIALARRYGLDVERVRLAALGHDLVRHKTGPQLLRLASDYGVTVDDIEARSPILVHGPIAARMLARDFGYQDADVLMGIDCHTTARAGMRAIEQALFVADKVEPHKLSREPELAEVVAAASESLDAGVLRYLDFLIAESLRRHFLLHPRTLEARNELLVKLGRDGG